nr:uncharacterized protein LOC111997851 [Quercus suber]
MLSASASLPPMCGTLSRGPQAFANGALHLIAVTNDKKPFVLVFDLGDDIFRQILLLELLGKMVWICVSIYGKSIAGFQKRVRGGKLNIWVMKEYGVASLWTQFTHQYLKLGMAKQCPVGFRRNGEVVLRNDRGGLVSWNPDTQKIKDIEINRFCCTLVGSYVESLVLLDKASNSVVTY